MDASRLTTSISLTHERGFETASGVACEPPNHLARLSPRYHKINVLGAGKTGIDSVVWILEQGFPPDALTWVMPRDSWYWNRNWLQPGMRFFDATIGNLVDQHEACAAADSIEDLCLRMERNGSWLRFDRDAWPSLYHSATVSEIELEQLCRVENVVRLGVFAASSPID